jgi:hypothetical protein
MPLFDVTPLLATRMCPKCEEDRLHMQLVTDETMYFRCVTCCCVWQEHDQRLQWRRCVEPRNDDRAH